LNDNEEELTHYGQSLSEIEKFDNPDISDDEDDEALIGAVVVVIVW
jgi:nucleolar protein 14